MSPIPPTTNYSSITEAQTRLLKPPKFNLFRRRKRSSGPPIYPTPLTTPIHDGFIDIHPVTSDPFETINDDQDQYRWAVVYENQRGIKLFSPHYSATSLLPSDPSPFTTPTSSSAASSKQPDVSLANYPLPDGSWRWLGTWMIDMRSDSGEVQVDGFEYNLAFRTHKWHPEAGPLSWVRRRRWIRLMMRAAKRKDAHLADSLSHSSATPAGSDQHRISIASIPLTGETEIKPDQVWISSEAQINWERYRLSIRAAGTDGRIIEYWQGWLGDEASRDRRVKRKQWTEDEELLPSQVEAPSQPLPAPAPRDYLLPALRDHAKDILQSFIYPESRARFIELLGRVGVVDGLRADVEFWSYVNK
ncbi:hypothetical protein FB45DRAFT_1058858 [Roridomyces roridus]|uniref:TECPR1-like DysF domain-containing protein n=1 Tax=Roridomyces roridus TaxID=1738132 RepID=A0AAD7BUQ6_9AGAR|nr:hypothetical protein FB45DRAFT_1058858 [Roridomyces roridus]